VEILWNIDKNKLLLETRQISFDMVLDKIVNNDFLGPEINPSRKTNCGLLFIFMGIHLLCHS